MPKPPSAIAMPFKRWIPEYHLCRAQQYHAEAVEDVKLIGTQYQEWAKKPEYADLVLVNGRYVFRITLPIYRSKRGPIIKGSVQNCRECTMNPSGGRRKRAR